MPCLYTYAKLITCVISFNPYRAMLSLDLGLQFVLLTPSPSSSPFITAAFHFCCMPSILTDTPRVVAFPKNCAAEPWFLSLLWKRKGRGGISDSIPF